MRKLIVIALAAGAAVIGMVMMIQPKTPEWTTDSREALEAFQEGLNAQMKLYHREAYEHFQKALELDPDFVAARVFLEDHTPGEAKKELLAQLEKADLETVTPREKFLVRYRLATAAGRGEEARKLLAEFLAKDPQDPYALRLQCDDPSSPQSAEDCFRQLIALEPNFVQAQNLLGYLAMGQGRFEEAEERFRTYQYIAPDQANPHDSMGELLLMLGRYDEAKKELEKALELRPDFDASYSNLVRIAILQENFEEARAVVRQVEDLATGNRLVERLRCEVNSQEAFLKGDWEQVWQESEACKRDRGIQEAALRFRADLWTGRLDDAQAIETYVAKAVTGARVKSDYGGNLHLGLHYHLKGLRFGAEGQLEEAIENLQEADRWFPYATYNIGALKIQNHLTLAALLDSLGEKEKAAALRKKVRSINPDFLRFEKLLALPRLEKGSSEAT